MDKLNDIFDIDPMEEISNEPIKPSEGELITTDKKVSPPKDHALEHDYQTTRSNLHNLLLQGEDALYNALEVAKQSEHPRAFEVVGGLIKQMADINTQLLDLHKKKQAIQKDSGEENQTNVTNNNAIFVGSTTDLSKMLANLNKEK